MSLKGNLASVNLTEIFQMLSLSGREGTLFIYEGARKRAICFNKEGVSIRSRERNEANLIGKILVRLGYVDETALAHAIEQKRSTNRLLGDILVDSGACSKEDIENAFATQSQEDLQELFLSRTDAQFEYVDGYFPETDAPFVDLNVNALLIEIARRTDEWEYIRRCVRGPREIYRFTGEEGEVEADILTDCYAHRIDALIDGTRSVGEIIDESYVNKFHVCKLLSAYLDANVIQPVPVDAIRQQARLALRMGDAESAIRHYDYLMTAGDFSLELMAEAAEAHESNRDFAEASALLRRLAEEHVREGNDRDAIDILRRIANFPNPEPEALRYLLDLAIANPRLAPDFAAHVVEAGKTLVAHYLRCDQRTEAQSMLDSLISILPDEISFAVSLVNLYYDQGNVDRAAIECERMANSFLKRKAVSPAVSLYKKLLVIDPERQDIRDKIRKIVAGKKGRKSGSRALPRVLVAFAVFLLLGGAAVVYIRHEGGVGGTGPTIDREALERLVIRAQSEAGIAATQARATMRQYAELLDLLGDNPINARKSVEAGLATVRQHLEEFNTRAETAEGVLEHIREQRISERDASLVRTMLSTLHDQGANVRAEQAKWERRAGQVAQGMANQGVARYEEGKLNLALECFELARVLSTSREWIEEAGLENYIENIRADQDAVTIKFEQARTLEAANRWVEARRIYIELLGSYARPGGHADLINEIRLPVELVTVPGGATIFLNDKKLAKVTPAVVRLTPFEATKVRLVRNTFQTKEFQLGKFGPDTDPAKYQYVSSLPKEPTWVHTLAGRIEARPAVWDGYTAVMARNGRWAVWKSATGEKVRASTIPGSSGFRAGLMASGKLVFAASLGNKLYTIHVGTGRVTSRDLPLSGGVYATPVLRKGVLYIADATGKVVAIDPVSGAFKWAAPVQTAHGVGEGLDLVALGDDLVITTTDGTVTILRCADGKQMGNTYRMKGPFACAPAPVGKSGLVFANKDGLLQYRGRNDVTTPWSKQFEGSFRRTLPVRGRSVVVSTGPQEFVEVGHQTGDINYRYRRSRSSARTAVAATDRIFFAHGRTLIAWAGTRDGYAPAWTFEAHGEILSGPIVRDGGVYFGDDKGFFYRLDADDE
ncbi:MAG: DUF4388 domain-containing protein [Planctomycetota bacterium]|jgi:outer membrane protein assembly factor BamB